LRWLALKWARAWASSSKQCSVFNWFLGHFLSVQDCFESTLASHVASRAMRAAGQECCVVGRTVWSPPTPPLVQHCQFRGGGLCCVFNGHSTSQQRPQASSRAVVATAPCAADVSWCHTSAAAAVAIGKIQLTLCDCRMLHGCDCCMRHVWAHAYGICGLVQS
jgi:hypothetical protein